MLFKTAVSASYLYTMNKPPTVQLLQSTASDKSLRIVQHSKDGATFPPKNQLSYSAQNKRGT